MAKTDLEKKIESLQEYDGEDGWVKTESEVYGSVYCCGKERKPEAILKFPDDESQYFVCPNCKSY